MTTIKKQKTSMQTTTRTYNFTTAKDHITKTLRKFQSCFLLTRPSKGNPSSSLAITDLFRIRWNSKWCIVRHHSHITNTSFSSPIRPSWEHINVNYSGNSHLLIPNTQGVRWYCVQQDQRRKTEWAKRDQISKILPSQTKPHKENLPNTTYLAYKTNEKMLWLLKTSFIQNKQQAQVYNFSIW